MTALLIVGGLVVATAIVTFVGSLPRNAGPDYGTVSNQWLAEYRQSNESDKGR
jgi:hypothetical protein